MSGYYTQYSKVYGPEEVGDGDLPQDTVEQIAFGYGELNEDGIAQFEPLDENGTEYVSVVWRGDPPKICLFHNGRYNISFEEVVDLFSFA